MASFGIDVDLSGLLGAEEPILVDARVYERLERARTRSPEVQARYEAEWMQEILKAQWRARKTRRQERRKAIRAPILSRVEVEGAKSLVACDISLSGMRAVGKPPGESFQASVRLPGTGESVSAKVAVVKAEAGHLFPKVSLRFLAISEADKKKIAAYVGARRRTRSNGGPQTATV